MHLRTTTSARTSTGRSRTHVLRRRPPTVGARPGLFLGVAAAGALVVNVVVGAEPAARAEPAASQPISVSEQLGLSAQSTAVDLAEDLDPLEDLAASRSAREAAQAEAARSQAAADQAELERQRAEARAKKRAEARAKAAAAAKAAAEQAAEAAAEQAATDAGTEAPSGEQGSGGAAAPAAAAGSTAVSAVAQISNSAGGIRPQAQAAADAVVSNVPGASGITLGGTRASAADPGGHPSGLAVDYMVMSDSALGDAIVQYHIAHWDELGVDYIIWQQRYLSSPGGGWSYMEDRGSSTANHMDHPHVNYRG
jgi:hypothetical protein